MAPSTWAGRVCPPWTYLWFYFDFTNACIQCVVIVQLAQWKPINMPTGRELRHHFALLEMLRNGGQTTCVAEKRYFVFCSKWRHSKQLLAVCTGAVFFRLLQFIMITLFLEPMLLCLFKQSIGKKVTILIWSRSITLNTTIALNSIHVDRHTICWAVLSCYCWFHSAALYAHHHNILCFWRYTQQRWSNHKYMSRYSSNNSIPPFSVRQVPRATGFLQTQSVSFS